MNMKRFAAPTTREAMQLVRAAFGDDAVVLSTKPCPAGIEVLAMASEGLADVQRQEAPVVRADSSVQEDVSRMAMSTLSFQDYVRERMLRRRRAELDGRPDPFRPQDPPAEKPRTSSTPEQRAQRAQAQMQALGARRVERTEPTMENITELPVRKPGLDATRAAARDALREASSPLASLQAAPSPRMAAPVNPRTEARERVRPASRAEEPTPLRRSPPVLRDEVASAPAAASLSDFGATASRSERETAQLAAELKAVKGLIEQRFGALAFMEKLQRQPAQARLAQRLLEAGFSPLLTRRLVDACPSTFAGGADEQQWAEAVLARNLQVAELPLDERQGVFALVGSTGVGKTTSTAKIAAAFAARHGASQLGLITLDAYRIGAHEQLRAYGRILGVPVHTAHDRASLEDLLDLLANKRLVLIDTAGLAQRDSRTGDLLGMLAHPAIRRLLVLSAASQGETLEDQIQAWRATPAEGCEGVILAKIDEAVRLAPALDGLIRHKLKLQGVANGQRVPEDWLRLSAESLLQHAFQVASTGPAWQLDDAELQLRLAMH
ncbi:flagellar biosynthesis protein FlhF [Inhella sp.]|uniref:flagellar biosynthesis protein FlhF n=1 Tax=Inhella sp. TaxID=1921806 RepID=UPI0035AFFC8A